jgi:hypothetical protein
MRGLHQGYWGREKSQCQQGLTLRGIASIFLPFTMDGFFSGFFAVRLCLALDQAQGIKR